MRFHTNNSQASQANGRGSLQSAFQHAERIHQPPIIVHEVVNTVNSRFEHCRFYNVEPLKGYPFLDFSALYQCSIIELLFAFKKMIVTATHGRSLPIV